MSPESNPTLPSHLVAMPDFSRSCPGSSSPSTSTFMPGTCTDHLPPCLDGGPAGSLPRLGTPHILLLHARFCLSPVSLAIPVRISRVPSSSSSSSRFLSSRLATACTLPCASAPKHLRTVNFTDAAVRRCVKSHGTVPDAGRQQEHHEMGPAGRRHANWRRSKSDLFDAFSWVVRMTHPVPARTRPKLAGTPRSPHHSTPSSVSSPSNRPKDEFYGGPRPRPSAPRPNGCAATTMLIVGAARAPTGLARPPEPCTTTDTFWHSRDVGCARIPECDRGQEDGGPHPSGCCSRSASRMCSRSSTPSMIRSARRRRRRRVWRSESRSRGGPV
ncbi:hypothetical protein V8D89_005274 [Ganoderma adspersum]